MSDSDYDCDAPSSNSDGSSVEEEQAELTMDKDDHDIFATAQTKKSRYHSPCKKAPAPTRRNPARRATGKSRSAMAMLDLSDSPDDDDDSEAPSPAHRATGNGHTAMLDFSDSPNDDDDDSKAPAPAPARHATGKGRNGAHRAAGKLKTEESDSDEEDSEDDDSEAPAPARRATGKGRNGAHHAAGKLKTKESDSDEEDSEDDDSEAPAPAPARRATGKGRNGAPATGKLKTEESDSDEEDSEDDEVSVQSVVSFSKFKFTSSKQVKVSDIKNEAFKSECRSFIYSRPFTGTFSNLPDGDKKEMKAIFDKHGMTGEDVGCFLPELVRNRRKIEAMYLKSEEPTNFQVCRMTRSNGKPYSHKYDPSFGAALARWHQLGGKTPADCINQLFKDAQALIKKWIDKKVGEPNLRDMDLGVRINIVSRANSEAAQSRYDERDEMSNHIFDATLPQLGDDLEEVFDGRLVVRLYSVINDGMAGVNCSFNISESGPSPFHGFTIFSGADVLSDFLMEKYSNAFGNKWNAFLRILRRYGVQEDICNVGSKNSADLGDFNQRKFIFYHEHLHKSGLEDMKGVRQLSNKVFQD